MVMEAKFKVGDCVKTNWIGDGVVTDILYSSTKGKYFYEVTNKDTDDSAMFAEDELELIPEKKEYSMDIKIDIANNVLIATLYGVANESKGVVAKGHGHLIHQGAFGIAQAASYACRRLFENMGGFKNNGC
jgi:hypothetical protein